MVQILGDACLLHWEIEGLSHGDLLHSFFIYLREKGFKKFDELFPNLLQISFIFGTSVHRKQLFGF